MSVMVSPFKLGEFEGDIEREFGKMPLRRATAYARNDYNRI